MTATAEDSRLMRQVWKCSAASWLLLLCWLVFGSYSWATHNSLDLINLLGEVVLAALAFISFITSIIATVYAYRLVGSKTAADHTKLRAALMVLPGAALVTIWLIGSLHSR